MGGISASGVVEVATGLAFVYLLLSLICTVVNEWISGILSSRAKNLEAGIRELFTNGNLSVTVAADGKTQQNVTLADAVYAHGLVQSLFRRSMWDRALRRKEGKPSYIPSKIFAATLIDVLLPANAGVSRTAADLQNAISNLPPGKGKQALLALVTQAGNDIASSRQAIEAWYNDGMDRVSGWYKRKSSLVLLILACIVTGATNTDSVLMARTLWNNPALRSTTAAAAQRYVQAYRSKDKGADKAQNQDQTTPAQMNIGAQDVKNAVDELNDQLRVTELPIGWPSDPNPKDPRSFPRGPWEIFFRILGWSVTAIALSLGAPFWFDVLNRFMVVRSTIKPHEKSGDEGSKDAKAAT